ncbi:MAG: HINT domain-containing protein [Planctomycetes bacterium]|nr:HINT domain-containing protein [Planctomycetota bacterium]
MDAGWSTVEEVFDTGEYERVYNLRVAEWHTYFVGGEGWSEAVWAHNTACIGSYGVLVATTGYEKHHIGQDAAIDSLPMYSRTAAPAITLFGGNSFKGSAHYEATQEQRRRNAALRATGATQMTVAQQVDGWVAADFASSRNCSSLGTRFKRGRSRAPNCGNYWGRSSVE